MTEKVDVQRWCARLGASHEKLDEAELMGVVGWLAGLDIDRLAQSLELAGMVAELRLDRPAVLAAFAYTAFRRGHTNEEELRQHLGADGAKLCITVAALATSSLLEVSDAPLMAGKENAQVENIKRMLVSLIQDFRVAVIKLAERVLALRHAKHYDEERQHGVLLKPPENHCAAGQPHGNVAAPVELEDLSLRYLREDIYLGIAKQLKRRRQEREEQVGELVSVVQSFVLRRQVSKRK